MTFIRTALTLALVATLAIPATANAGGIGGTWFPTLTWPTDAAPAEPGPEK